MILFFVCKQKTAYEMRISDWSSDVCSSDLDHVDGSEVHTVTVTVPAGFAVTGLAGGDQIGDTITWTVTGGSLDVELQVVADDPLTVEQPVSWHAEAKAVEQVTDRSEEHTSELQSLMRISYAVFCLKKKNKKHTTT